MRASIYIQLSNTVVLCTVIKYSYHVQLLNAASKKKPIWIMHLINNIKFKIWKHATVYNLGHNHCKNTVVEKECMFKMRGISIADRIGCTISQHSWGIALCRPRIGIGILLTFLKWQELVVVFYWQSLNGQNLYWYFIGVQN